MQKTYSYKNCYRILDANPSCSWIDLRKSYKKSIQKWHPDRFEDGSQEKIAADDKIKTINTAYNHIAKYYRHKGKLPQITGQDKSNQTNQHTPKPETEPAQPPTHPSENSKSTIYQQHRKPHKSEPTKRYKIIVATILVTLSAAYFHFNNTSIFVEPKHYPHNHISKENTIKPQASQNYLNDNLSLEDNSTSYKKQNDEQVEIKDEYFTNGSSFSAVISIQGAPTKTDGDIWFYGRSEVHFNNGTVSYWIRDSETPLKAHMSIKYESE